MRITDEKQVLEFESLLEELRKQLLDACVHFDIWVQLFPTAQVVDVINQYVGFFQPTREAHRDRFFIKVSNVTSSDPKSSSFYRILKMLDNNPALASGVNVRSLRKRLKQHKKVLEAIKDYRDTRGAHWDTQVRAQRKPVLFGESRRMLNELQDMFNEICGAHSGNVWSFKYSQQDNTASLLNTLKLWRQQKPLANPAREVEMGEREELKKQRAEWTVKLVEAKKRRDELSPKVIIGEHVRPIDMTPVVMDKEYYAKYEQAEKDIEEAKAKLTEIEDRLSKLE